MTNEQLQVLKKYINMSAIKEMLPVNIPNFAEKLAGSNGRGKGKYYKERIFTSSELLYIEGALLAIAHQINENKVATTEENKTATAGQQETK